MKPLYITGAATRRTVAEATASRATSANAKERRILWFGATVFFIFNVYILIEKCRVTALRHALKLQLHRNGQPAVSEGSNTPLQRSNPYLLQLMHLVLIIVRHLDIEYVRHAENLMVQQ